MSLNANNHTPDQLRAEISELTQSLPRDYQSWSHNRIMAYKQAVSSAIRVSSVPGQKQSSLAAVLQHLRRFYPQPADAGPHPVRSAGTSRLTATRDDGQGASIFDGATNDMS